MSLFTHQKNRITLSLSSGLIEFVLKKKSGEHGRQWACNLIRKARDINDPDIFLCTIFARCNANELRDDFLECGSFTRPIIHQKFDARISSQHGSFIKNRFESLCKISFSDLL